MRIRDQGVLRTCVRWRLDRSDRPDVGEGLRRREREAERGKKEARPDAARMDAKDLVPKGTGANRGRKGVVWEDYRV
jgi:hypothetical protein